MSFQGAGQSLQRECWDLKIKHPSRISKSVAFKRGFFDTEHPHHVLPGFVDGVAGGSRHLYMGLFV